MINDARGDIITRWVFQIAALMAILAFLGFEGGSVIMAHLSLDEDARQVAITTRRAYRDADDIDEAIEAGTATANEQGIEVVSVATANDEELVFELARTASTLVLHRIGALEQYATVRTTRAVPLTP